MNTPTTQQIIPQENEIWTAKDCADYLRFSQRHFVDTISKRPGFPQRLPGSTRKNILWKKRDVINWLNGGK